MSVASDRPLITHPPSSYTVIQSPWVQTPGNRANHVDRIRSPSASPQSATGIDGIGAVITSSPGSPRTSRPSSSKAWTSTPSIGPGISPARTGSSGAAPTNPLATSVPPEVELTRTSAPNASAAHRKPSAGSGDPVEPSIRSAPRSWSRPGRRPASRHIMRNDAEVPNCVSRSDSAIAHSASVSGQAGLPSKQTTVAPTSSAETPSST